MQLTLFLDPFAVSRTYCIRTEAGQRFVICAKFIDDHFGVMAETISVQVERKAFKGSKKIAFVAGGFGTKSVRIDGDTDSYTLSRWIEGNFKPGTYYVRVTPA